MPQLKKLLILLFLVPHTYLYCAQSPTVSVPTQQSSAASLAEQLFYSVAVPSLAYRVSQLDNNSRTLPPASDVALYSAPIIASIVTGVYLEQLYGQSARSNLKRIRNIALAVCMARASFGISLGLCVDDQVNYLEQVFKMGFAAFGGLVTGVFLGELLPSRPPVSTGPQYLLRMRDKGNMQF